MKRYIWKYSGRVSFSQKCRFSEKVAFNHVSYIALKEGLDIIKPERENWSASLHSLLNRFDWERPSRYDDSCMKLVVSSITAGKSPLCENLIRIMFDILHKKRENLIEKERVLLFLMRTKNVLDPSTQTMRQNLISLYEDKIWSDNLTSTKIPANFFVTYLHETAVSETGEKEKWREKAEKLMALETKNWKSSKKKYESPSRLLSLLWSGSRLYKEKPSPNTHLLLSFCLHQILDPPHQIFTNIQNCITFMNTMNQIFDEASLSFLQVNYLFLMQQKIEELHKAACLPFPAVSSLVRALSPLFSPDRLLERDALSAIVRIVRLRLQDAIPALRLRLEVGKEREQGDDRRDGEKGRRGGSREREDILECFGGIFDMLGKAKGERIDFLIDWERELDEAVVQNNLLYDVSSLYVYLMRNMRTRRRDETESMIKNFTFYIRKIKETSLREGKIEECEQYNFVRCLEIFSHVFEMASPSNFHADIELLEIVQEIFDEITKKKYFSPRDGELYIQISFYAVSYYRYLLRTETANASLYLSLASLVSSLTSQGNRFFSTRQMKADKNKWKKKIGHLLWDASFLLSSFFPSHPSSPLLSFPLSKVFITHQKVEKELKNLMRVFVDKFPLESTANSVHENLIYMHAHLVLLRHFSLCDLQKLRTLAKELLSPSSPSPPLTSLGALISLCELWFFQPEMNVEGEEKRERRESDVFLSDLVSICRDVFARLKSIYDELDANDCERDANALTATLWRLQLINSSLIFDASLSHQIFGLLTKLDKVHLDTPALRRVELVSLVDQVLFQTSDTSLSIISQSITNGILSELQSQTDSWMHREIGQTMDKVLARSKKRIFYEYSPHIFLPIDILMM